MDAALFPRRPSPALVEALERAGLRVVPVADAAAVGEAEPAEGWAIVVVEVGAPRALNFARRVREEYAVPVLVVAGPHRTDALAEGGFDDFLLTPVDDAELRVRVSRLAGSGGTSDDVARFKDLELNVATFQATLGTHPMDLTYMEYELLRFFVEHQARVWSREQLLSKVWGYDYFDGSRTVDVHVRRLRAKLGEERASWIATVRSVGYRFG
jgi:DNA-binding response OmpR family regulator